MFDYAIAITIMATIRIRSRHNPVTSHYVMCPVPFSCGPPWYRRMKSAPGGSRLSRNTGLPPHPTTKMARARLQKELIPSVGDPAFRTPSAVFVPKIDLSIESRSRDPAQSNRFVSFYLTVGICPKSWCPWRATGTRLDQLAEKDRNLETNSLS